jgi:hypothetical protein
MIGIAIHGEESRVQTTETGGFSFRRALWCLIVLSSLCVTGCRNDGTIVWSAEVHSPDRRWLASAATKQWGGPGGAYVSTSVYLRPIGSNQRAFELLGLADPTAYPIGITSVKLTWITPTHLDIDYSDRSTVDLQVVKFQDIEITAQARSRDSASPPSHRIP